MTPANAAFPNTTTPTLTATFSDPDAADTGTVNFRVCADAACPTILSTFSSAALLANGANGSAAVPGAAGLVNGTTYYWQAQNKDNSNVQSAFSASRSFTVDTTAPAVPSLVITESNADSHASGSTFYYRPAGAGGTFTATATTSDATSLVKHVTFPGLAGGFTPAAPANDTTPAYAQVYTWPATTGTETGAKNVTAEDNATNISTAGTFTLTADSAAPVGGALTVNSVAASGGGTQSYDNDGTFTIGLRTDYTDAISGIATSTLTREQGTLNADACSAYGAPTTLVGTPAQSGLATGCYRYILTGTDNVGNAVSITTIVKVDTSAPAAPGLVLSDSSADVHTTGTTAFYRPAGSGSFDVTASSTDAQSGILDYSFPALAGFTGSGTGATRTYTLATPTEPNGAKPVNARNKALLSSAATNFTLTSDSVGPTGGALTVNGAAASGGGSQSYDGDGSLHDRPGRTTTPTRSRASPPPCSPARRARSPRDACSSYGAPTTIVGTPAQSGLATGCYRYVLTGTDNVGNTTTITTVVKVDTSDPTAPVTLALRLERRGAHDRHHRLLPPDRQRLLRRHGELDRRAVRHRLLLLPRPRRLHDLRRRRIAHLHARDADRARRRQARVRPEQGAARSNSSNFTLTSDAVDPTGGALDVNGVASSLVGTQSYDDDGSFTIGTRTDYADTLSGLASSTLTREDGTLAGDACSSYGAPTTIVGTPAQNGLATGCYRYTLTGIDNVGNSVSLTTVVKVDLTDPTAPSLSLADSSADVHTVGTTAFYRPAGTGSFDVTASSTDGQSGILDYSFPTLAGFVATGSGATKTYTLNTPTEPDGGKTVTAQNNAGRTNGSTFTLTADSTAPSGGSITVNGGGSYDTDGTVALAKTNHTDGGSGVASQTFTRAHGDARQRHLRQLRRH